MGRWEGLRSANELRRTHPWAVAGSFLGGVGALSGAVIAALALFVNDGSSGGAGPATGPTTTAKKRVLITPPEYTYHVVRDDTKALSLSVPKQWKTVYGDGWHSAFLPPIKDGTRIGPGLNATPSFTLWQRDKRTPGIFVGASKRLVANRYTPRRLLKTFVFKGCDAGAVRSFETDAKAGGTLRWTCPGTSARWYTSAWWPPTSHAYLVYIQMKLVTSSDDEALQEILETLTVRGALIE